MRRAPRNLEEWLFFKLMDSDRFHLFVRKIYRRVNGIPEISNGEKQTAFQYLYKPTRAQKFKAFRLLFWDEIRSTFGLSKKAQK